jgi:hypothetical protein
MAAGVERAMTDETIEARLRALSREYCPEAHEAADELARLRAALAHTGRTSVSLYHARALKESEAALRKALDGTPFVGGRKRQYAVDEAAIQGCLDELARLRAENERLRTAGVARADHALGLELERLRAENERLETAGVQLEEARHLASTKANRLESRIRELEEALRKVAKETRMNAQYWMREIAYAALARGEKTEPAPPAAQGEACVACGADPARPGDHHPQDCPHYEPFDTLGTSRGGKGA